MRSRRLDVGFVCAAAIAMNVLLAAAVQTPSASNTSTPRLPDGKPDLTGVWSGNFGGGFRTEEQGAETISTFSSRRCGPNQKKCLEYTNQSYDGEFTGRFDSNRPLYHPDYWDKVQQLDYDTNFADPIMRCQPSGIPRVGPPSKILHQANQVIFLYSGGDASSSPAAFRVIPTDGRKHDPQRALDVTYFGHSVGRWDGDTLVVDSVGFNDVTWLQRGGYFHSDNMRVIETFRRQGATMTYEVTVEDPDVLLQPWVMNSRQLRLNTDPNYYMPEQGPCKDNYDADQMTTRNRH